MSDRWRGESFCSNSSGPTFMIRANSRGQENSGANQVCEPFDQMVSIKFAPIDHGHDHDDLRDVRAVCL